MPDPRSDAPHDPAAGPADPAATARRLADLERQVEALTRELAVQRTTRPALTPDPPSLSAFDRRALLRRTGAVLAAGVAGAVALPSVAAAAEGEPVLQGRPNDAGPTTGIAGGAAGPALELTNPTTAGTAAAPALRLTPSPATGGLDPATVRAGDLASSGELLWYGHASADAAGPGATGAVYTSAFANHLEFLDEPRRVLDTRPGGTTDENGSPVDRRTRVVAGSFDGSGRLRAGTALVLDLSGLLSGGAGVFANLTVVAPVTSGFLTAYPTPDGTPRTDGLDRPAASSLNFSRGTSALANAALVRLGAGSRITVFTTSDAHVLLDLVAVSVTEPFSLRRGGAALRRAAP